MNRNIIFVIVFILVLHGCATDVPQTGLQEIRGVWITNVDSEILFDPQSIEDGLAFLADRGFNIIFPVVWNKGYTLYPSDVMASYFGEEFRIDPLFAEQGRDPLREIIAAARKHNIDVIPWFEFGFAASYRKDGGHIIAAYPHWAAEDNTGALLEKNGFEWMNAFHHEVQDFMLALIREVCEHYDIDGVQGDDRLPALPSEGGYSEYTRELYYREAGTYPPDDSREPGWLQWKADKLTEFGGRLYHMVKEIRPELIVSMSPSIYPWSKEEYLQDWPEWIRRGQVDILHPQCYRYDIDSYKQTVEDVAFYAGIESRNGEQYIDLPPIVVAPGVLIKAGHRYNGPEYVKEAVRFNRQHGMQGEVYFFYEGLDEKNDFLADTLYQYFYSEPATLPYYD
jgi:uncharacterized lipoprotein YddW (UPF0748 family)